MHRRGCALEAFHRLQQADSITPRNIQTAQKCRWTGRPIIWDGQRPGPCGMRMRAAIRQPHFTFLSCPLLPLASALSCPRVSARSLGEGTWVRKEWSGELQLLFQAELSRDRALHCPRRNSLREARNHLTPLRCTVEALLLLAPRSSRANCSTTSAPSTTPHHSIKPCFHGSCLKPQPLFCLSPCFASIARVVFMIYF